MVRGSGPLKDHIHTTVVLIVWKQGDGNKEGVDVSMNYLQDLSLVRGF